MDRLRRDSYTGASWRRSYAIRDCAAALRMIAEEAANAIALAEARTAIRGIDGD
ncbi:MAG: hypothetical protein V3V60_01410 [Sphingomonas aquatilis]|jgi:hypothetical protein|uniref:hypothetical protein n=1 Tax=Sphingomonas aquatilis TaxID=93063 RepID=UPI002F356968